MTILMSNVRQYAAVTARAVAVSNPFRAVVKAQLRPLHIVNNAASPTTDLAIQGRNLTLSQREPRPAIVVIPVSVQSNSNGLSTLTSEQPVEKPRNLVLAEVQHAFESLLESPSSPSLSRKSSVSELTQSSICSTAPDTPSKSGSTGFERIIEILNQESNQKKAFEDINKILATFKRY